MLYFLLQITRIGAPWLGIVIPAAILIISCFLTWFLFKRFSGVGDEIPHSFDVHQETSEEN